MKVAETSTDRWAEAHLYVEGKVKELEEYGQYVDTTDKALCCYIPVEEGHKIKIGGRFSGTTLTVAYDAVVDGVYRKAGSSTSKAVCHQKNKKIEVNSFLVKMKDNIIDTAMVVARKADVKAVKGTDLETIGTIELRLYVTRQLGLSHAPSGIEKYSDSKGSIDDKAGKTVIYAQIAPSFQMTFETNVAPMEKPKANKEKKHMEAARPGTEPWAIFRFHYRNKTAIAEQKLDMTWDPNKKSKPEPHQLQLDAVPPLLLGSKILNDDGDNSTRTSSPTLAPSTPITKAQAEWPIKAPTTPAKQVPMRLPASVKSPRIDNTTAALDAVSTTASVSDMNEAMRTHILSKFNPKPTPKITNSPTLSKDAGRAPLSSSHTNDRDDGPVEIQKKNVVHSKPMNTVLKRLANGGTTMNYDYKIVDKDGPMDNDTIVVNSPKGISNKFNPNTNAPKEAIKKPAALSHKTVEKTLQQTATTAIPGKTTGKQAPIMAKDPPAQEMPSERVPDAIGVPTKRTADPAHSVSTDTKRQKPTPAPTNPIQATTVPRVPSASPINQAKGIECEIAEKRKQIEALRLKRAQKAKEQEELDKKIEPYKKRMAEELERLTREMEEEQNLAAEEEKRWNAGMEMLAEFEEGGGDE